jgi:hypothetical protein
LKAAPEAALTVVEAPTLSLSNVQGGPTGEQTTYDIPEADSPEVNCTF